MNVASIDIGTNSVLLLVAGKFGNQLKPIVERHEVPRLGKGVDQSRNLHPDSCERVINVLKGYREFLELHYPDTVSDVVVTATSAVRDAKNREQFLSMIKEATGWSVRMLSGDEEAFTTFYGALSVLDLDQNNYTVLDIGGGSTEIAFGVHGELKDYISLDMGSVRFSERFLKSNPPTEIQVNDARVEISKLLKSVKSRKCNSEAIGVAGTVTSVAAIELGLHEYDPIKINGYRLSLVSIRRFIDEFSSITAAEIEEQYPPFLTRRGDVILGGLLILEEFLKWSGNDEIVVSTGGIRHGILLEKI